MRSALIVSLLTLLLMACGQTGPLYLPKDTSAAPAAPATDPVNTQPTGPGSSP